MTIFRVRHLTTYSYRRPVRFGGHQLMFRPRDSYDQRLHEAELRVDPQPAAVRWIHDVFGNCVAHVAVAGRRARSSASRPASGSSTRRRRAPTSRSTAPR